MRQSDQVTQLYEGVSGAILWHWRVGVCKTASACIFGSGDNIGNKNRIRLQDYIQVRWLHKISHTPLLKRSIVLAISPRGSFFIIGIVRLTIPPSVFSI